MLQILHKVNNKTPLIESFFNKALNIESRKDAFLWTLSNSSLFPFVLEDLVIFRQAWAFFHDVRLA